MKPTPTLLAAIGLALLPCGRQSAAYAQAQDSAAKAVIAKSAAAYRAFNTLSMTITTVASGNGAPANVITRLTIAKPNRVGASMTAGKTRVVLVADGKNILSSTSQDSKRYLKIPSGSYGDEIRALQSSGGLGIGLIGLLLTDPQAETKVVPGTASSVNKGADVRLDGELCDVVEVDTVASNMPRRYTFSFAKSDHLLRKLITTPASNSKGPTVTETYTSVTLNRPVSSSAFAFTPPAGAKAVDPTKQAGPTVAALKQGGAPIALTGKDLTGKAVSLSQYKGKVVLIDFWATWCGPCMEEMPNVVSAYNRYHGRGFEIVGVTLDNANAHDKLVSFTSSHQMPWRQIYDGKGWGAANAVAYGVTGIPYSVLVGKDGKIAAISPRGPALAPAIEAALNHR